MNVLELFAKLTLDKSEYESGLDDASSEAEGFGSKLKSGLGVAAKGVGVGLAAATTAAVAAGAAFVKGTGDVAEYGDHIDKMSQKMGLSATAYQEWDAILQHSGTSIDAMKGGMKSLANAVETGSDAFTQLGMSQEEISQMSQEELFGETIKALQNVEDETQRTYLASKLLGKGGTELGALLNTSAEDTEKMRQRVHELGGVMSDEAVKSAAAYQDSLQDMQTAFGGLSRNILSEFMPSITTVMDGLTELFAGDSEGGLELINQGISDMMTKMSEAIPKIIEIGTNILNGLITAIVDNLPQIIETGTQLIIQLATGLMQALPELLAKIPAIISALIRGLMAALPQFLTAGRNLISSLASGIASNAPQVLANLASLIASGIAKLAAALPSFLAKGGEIIARIASGIVGAAGQVLSAIGTLITNAIAKLTGAGGEFLSKGGELIGKVASGITGAVGRVISAITGIISSIKNAITGGGWSGIGSGIISGIAGGISAGVGSIISAARNAAASALSAAKSFLGIASPSKVMRDQVGFQISAGVAEGIEDNLASVKDAMGDISDIAATPVNVGAVEAVGGTGYSNSVVMNIYGAIGQDVQELAEIVMEKLNYEYQKPARAWQ